MATEAEGSDIAWLEDELKLLKIRSDRIDPQGKPALLGTVLTDRSYRIDGLKSFVRSVWKTKGKFQIEDVGSNLFLFLFDREEDLAFVMNGGPWVFQKQWLLLSPLTRVIDRKEVEIYESPVWIRLYDIPPGSDKDDLIIKVGNSFGGIIDQEIKGKQVKVRVLFDVRYPLRRGIPIGIEDDEDEGHGLVDCAFTSEVQKQKPEYLQSYSNALRVGSDIPSIIPKNFRPTPSASKVKSYLGAIPLPKFASTQSSSASSSASMNISPSEGVPETLFPIASPQADKDGEGTMVVGQWDGEGNASAANPNSAQSPTLVVNLATQPSPITDAANPTQALIVSNDLNTADIVMETVPESESLPTVGRPRCMGVAKGGMTSEVSVRVARGTWRRSARVRKPTDKVVQRLERGVGRKWAGQDFDASSVPINTSKKSQNISTEPAVAVEEIRPHRAI